MKNVLVLNGPNLNLLGTREPEIYGSISLNELEAIVEGWGAGRGVAITCFQSNHEGELIDRIHDGRKAHDGMIINAGALTHYSYALHDAIVAAGLPTVEVHISNIKAREPWRRQSVIGPACVYTIYGRGVEGYRSAIDVLVNRATDPGTTISYGPADDHIADLRIPTTPGPHPVVVLIHGGFWRDHWTRDSMDGLAIDLTNRGWATWNLEYHRVGAGGGWPATLEDVATGIDHLASIGNEHQLDLGRVATVGHSAGGQLSLWAAVRPHLSDNIPDPANRVALQKVVGLAPVSDLDHGYQDKIGNSAVEEFIRRTPDDGADRYTTASPARLLPLDVPQVIVHGTADEAVPVQMSRGYVAAAESAGDTVIYHELDGVDHMNLIDPSHSSWALVVAELQKLR